MKLLPLFLLISSFALGQDNVGTFVPAHTDDITSIAFSPDGKYIVSGGWDNEINITPNRLDAEPAQRLQNNKGAIKTIAFSRDGYKMIAGGQDGRLTIYNFNSDGYTVASQDTMLLINECQINKLVYGPGMRAIFSAGDDGRFMMYDLSRDIVREVNTKRPITAAAVAIDRQSYFIANENNSDITQYDIFGRKLATFSGHAGDVTDMMTTVDRKYLISASEDKTIKIWDIAKGKIDHTFTNHAWSVTDIDVDLYGKYLVSCGLDGTVNLFDLKSKKLIWEKTYVGKKVQAVALSPDLTTLAVAIHSDDVNATGFYLEDTKLKARKIKLPKKAEIVKIPTPKPISVLRENDVITNEKSQPTVISSPVKKKEKEVVKWEDQIEIKISDEE